MVFPHPPSGERKQREPEQQVQIGPEYCASHRGTGMQHVMVVVPVDANIDETEDITEKHREQSSQIYQAAGMRDLHLQHHDRDNDRDHAVTECLQPPCGHRCTSWAMPIASSA